MRLLLTSTLLACTVALALPAQAQKTPATYKYSVSLAVAAPKGSAAEAIAKDKSQPAATRFTPCAEDKLDQLTFTLKYDAGKPAKDDRSAIKDVYLVFYKDGHYYPLIRQRLTSGTSFFKAYTDISAIDKADTYTAAENNLGGAQTETVLGGSMIVEELNKGVWSATAIIAARDEIDFDDPSTWSAWDTVTFMLGKPWQGVNDAVCK